MKLMHYLRISIVGCAIAAFICVLPGGAQAAPYAYTSDTYGFSIQAPQKPIGVLNLSSEFPGKKGVIMVFDNEGYQIKHAWIISTEGFSGQDPKDLDTMTPEATKKYLAELMRGAYEFAGVVQVDGRKALYTVTKGENKRVMTYVKGDKGYYAIILIENPEITSERVTEFQEGVKSFKLQ